MSRKKIAAYMSPRQGGEQDVKIKETYEQKFDIINETRLILLSRNMSFNAEDWISLYNAPAGKQHQIVGRRTGDEKKFVKKLRGNTSDRHNESISELITSNIFIRLGLGNLESAPAIWEGKPVIVMRCVEDANILDFTKEYLQQQFFEKEKFATLLFLGDLLVNNVNRDKGKLEHIGWERRKEDGKIVLLSLDNGHTLGYSSDGNLDNDDDLNSDLTLRFTNHFSSVLVPSGINADVTKETLTVIDSLNFDEIAELVKALITNAFAPDETELGNINARIDRVKAMLIRRKPMLATKVNQWLGITQPVV